MVLVRLIHVNSGNNIVELFNIAFLCWLSVVLSNDSMLWQLICFLEIQIPTRQNKQMIHPQDLLAQDTQKQEAKSRELRPF